MRTFTHLNAHDAELARRSRRVLADYAEQRDPVTIVIQNADQPTSIELPSRAIRVLIEALDALTAGQDVTILPADAELTTAQAAEILNVSRPYVVKLLEDGAIPFRKVGSHRRIRREDLMAFKTADNARRQAVMDELIRLAQEEDMGYPRP